jgi:hypothetical protein
MGQRGDPSFASEGLRRVNKFRPVMLLSGIFIGWSYKTIKFSPRSCRKNLWATYCLVILINKD